MLRVLSEDDPVVPFETIDQTLFTHIHSVVVQKASWGGWGPGGGGHCAAFYHDPSLAEKIRDFAQQQMSLDEY